MSITFSIEGVQEGQDYELNVANTNGIELLQYLGIPAAYEGSTKPADILIALNREPEQGLLKKTVSDGNWTVHGRTPGQVAHYYTTLRRIAEKAKEYGRDVVWG